MVKFCFFESNAILAIATAMNPWFCVNFKRGCIPYRSLDS